MDYLIKFETNDNDNLRLKIMKLDIKLRYFLSHIFIILKICHETFFFQFSIYFYDSFMAGILYYGYDSHTELSSMSWNVIVNKFKQ